MSDFLADATRQAQGDGADPVLLGLLNESVPGVSGIAESYLLLRREVANNPKGVSEEIAQYRARLREVIEEAARRNKNYAAFRQEAVATLATLDAVDTSITEATKQIPIIGQIVGGLLQISDMFVKSKAELQAQGIDQDWGGVVFGAGEPVFWGWRRGSSDPRKRGYWIWDTPVLSFQASMMATKYADTSPSFTRQHAAVAQLATAFPYGLPEGSIESVTISNSGYVDVQDAQGNYVKVGDKPGINVPVSAVIAAFSPPNLDPKQLLRFAKPVIVKTVIGEPPPVMRQPKEGTSPADEVPDDQPAAKKLPTWAYFVLGYLAYKGVSK